MPLKILIDMNLAPGWVRVFSAEGWEAVHWSSIGDPRAPDAEIMDWAKSRGYVVFTHDLDFSAILAATRAAGPSVVQVRAQDILPQTLGPLVTATLRRFQLELEEGALITVDPGRARVRILPLLGQIRE